MLELALVWGQFSVWRKKRPLIGARNVPTYVGDLKRMNNIYLIGFMGTGKTAVGKELAKIKKWQFIDLDELIQLREKRTIADIFAKEGEPYFRKVEKQVLKEVAGEKGFVVSCGGGIVLDKENIQVMSQTGIMICLSARPEVILKRTAGYRHRPLLNNVENPEKRIKELLSQRAPYYAQADYTIDTSDLSVSTVTDRIIEYVKGKRGKSAIMT